MTSPLPKLGALTRVALIVCLIGAEMLTAFVMTDRPNYALPLAVLAAALATLLIRPAFIAVLVLPACWLSHRVGPQSLNMSVSDAVLLAAAVPSLLLAGPLTPAIRRGLLASGVYLGVLALAVATHPSQRAVFELFHRTSLTVGVLVAAAAVVSNGLTHWALRAFLATSSVYAIAAIQEGASSGWRPAYPLGEHKNAAGSLIALALVVLVVAPGAFRIRRPLALAAGAALAGGLLATQNRGAMVALVAALALWLVLTPGRAAAKTVVLAVCALLAVVVVSSVRRDEASASQFDSINSRAVTYSYALDLWRAEPIGGAGLRYWAEPGFYAKASAQGATTFGEPHNVIVSALSESGVLGLAAMAFFVGSLGVALRRTTSDLSTAGLIVLAKQVVDTQFGIWWVAGTAIAPLVIIGLALASDRAQARGDHMSTSVASFQG